GAGGGPVGGDAPHGDEPAAAVRGDVREAIAARDVKREPTAAGGLLDDERQRRGGDASVRARDHQAESAFGGEGEACGFVDAKGGGDVHGRAPGGRTTEDTQPRNFWEEVPRGRLRRERR